MTNFKIQKGDRIAQMIYERIYKPTLVQVSSFNELEETDRGTGGFGSTGV